MARIVITSAGTGGDFVPFVAMGKALRLRGQDVLMAINPAMLPLARDAGVDAVPCGRTFGAAAARQRSFVFDHWQDVPLEERRRQWETSDLRGNYLELDAACRHADLLVASSLQVAATPECYRRAAAVGAALQTEDGLNVARTLIEQELRQGC